MRRKPEGRVHGPASDAWRPGAGGGIAAGAIIYTKDGALPVEYLCPGDRIITRDAGLVTLRAVDWRRGRVDRVRIRRGVLGHLRPLRDTEIPADQGVLIRDWRAQALFGAAQAVVPAARLVDGAHVTDEGAGEMTLFTLRFDRPHVIYADGLELAAAAPAAAEA